MLVRPTASHWEGAPGRAGGDHAALARVGRAGPAPRGIDQAASEARSVDLMRAALPPGGCRGDGSRLASASRIASIETVRRLPGIARNAGHDAIAAASEAQDARMARFSALDKLALLPEAP